MKLDSRMKKTFTAIGVLLVLSAVYLWSSPYFTIVSISNALLDRDPQSLGRHVDFPALRNGLKNQSSALFAKKMPDSQNKLFSSIGRLIGSQVIQKIIDSAVTPEGMIALASEAAGLPEKGAELKGWWKRTFAPFLRARYGYDSLSTFSYWLPTDEGEIHFVLNRSGLEWQMTNAIIPPELIKSRLLPSKNK